jgi:hypothetical protein
VGARREVGETDKDASLPVSVADARVRVSRNRMHFPVVLTGLELVPVALNLVPSYACFLLVRSESSGKPKT